MPADLVFFALAGAIGLLLALVAGFAILVVLLRLANERKARRWQRMESQWESRLLDTLAGGEPEAILGHVSPGDTFFFVDFLLRFAQRVQGAEKQIMCQLARPFLPAIALRTHTGDAEQRARAVLTVGTLGLGDYAAEVAAALDDPAPLVAMVAARALARRETPQYVRPVLERLHRFRDWRPSFLAGMLAAVGPAVAPELRAFLADTSRDARVRAVCARALEELNDLESGAVAGDLLTAAEDRELLAACLRLVREVGQPQHLPAVRALCQSADAVIRAQALRALGRLGSQAEAPLLLAGLDDPSPWVAIQAGWALHESGQKQAVADLAASSHPRSALARQILLEAQGA